jgi:hypothetical protein
LRTIFAQQKKQLKQRALCRAAGQLGMPNANDNLGLMPCTARYGFMMAAVLACLVPGLWTTAAAKQPGARHCYGKVCVQVLSIAETENLVGRTVELTASHYDDPSVDPFNRGTFTSNGERFVADDPTRTASATFPDGTELLLRNPTTGRVSHVRVNDFGPFWANR